LFFVAVFYVVIAFVFSFEIFDWFEKAACQADILKSKKMHPALWHFEAFLQELKEKQ
jgi:hypothetical protein